MDDFNKYLSGILTQIKDSVKTLENLKDVPGDLKIISTELAKINGLIQVVVKKLETADNKSDKYVKFSSAATYYLENYSFEREIEIMSQLYSDDPHRLKNIRLSILKSIYEKKMLEKADSIMED